MQDVRLGTPLWQPQLMWVLDAQCRLFAVSWLVLQRWYGRTGGIDLGLVFMHLDILVWLVNLRHLEQTHLFFGYLLMIRVADQVGYGFRRALYFSHVIVASYLVYSWWVAHQPGDPLWSERFTMAAAMYLLGIYLAFTGLVSARLRSRARQAIQRRAPSSTTSSGKRACSRSRRANSRRRVARRSRPTSPRHSSWPRSAMRSARR